MFFNLFENFGFDRNSEDVDVDGDKPYEERKEENGYVVGVKHECSLSGPVQKSADPILPALGLRDPNTFNCDKDDNVGVSNTIDDEVVGANAVSDDAICDDNAEEYFCTDDNKNNTAADDAIEDDGLSDDVKAGETIDDEVAGANAVFDDTICDDDAEDNFCTHDNINEDDTG
ncbi:hypothetical protein AWC38_SpisGene17903 [Stylophora pistillata]|uniref:Uncharacterized protein n=1 Tax=Stylophora pistillata TaxID=50429 RepID=A0A2B4RMM2_STYPI|nr:hypothetical protein AWC38_SpisGene17903 [Stylophora pistillata]